MTLTSINPATNEVLETYATLSPNDVQAAINDAHEAYLDWRQSTFAERERCLLKFAELLRADADELARTITLDMGKRIAESQYEIEYCANIAEYYAGHAATFLADQPIELSDAKAYLHYEPLGVILGIMPWNFPFYQVTRFAAPNLMAGNAVMIKHASNVPQCAEALAELFDECGLPKDVYTALPISSELIESIIDDERIRGVSLTGSEPAGAAVAARAGKNIKPSVLELGGNDPFIVLDDADPEEAARLAVQGRIVNAGQSCVAAKRFIVVASLAERFLAAFKQQFYQLKMGDPLDEATTLAPLSTEEAAEKLLEQVQTAVKHGATAVLGGHRPECEGAFFSPTILTDITPDNPVFDQELFGPVACVYVVPNQQAAIRLANNSSFGLGGTIITKDTSRGRDVAEQLETGMVFLNQPTSSQAELPFGGIKNSGYGRELSRLGILEFVNKKLIHLGPNE